MIRSIRQFLLISLLLSITIASSITAIGNYFLDRKILQPHLDEHLLKNFSFIEIITRLTKNRPEVQKEIRDWFQHGDDVGKKNLFFQVYSPEDQLLYFSGDYAEYKIPHQSHGFSDILIHDKGWRFYENTDPITGNEIIVAEQHGIRNQLIDNIARNNIYILLFTYPLFGILIWLIIGLALRSVMRVTHEISNRASTHLEPLATQKIPEEIKPLVSELNRLFLRLKLAFERDKRFASDAAHELRTPLAAIKAQAQVALREKDESTKQLALEKVIQGVDRSSHTVTQLLTLSRLGHEDELNDIRVIDLHRLVTEIVALLVPAAREKNITVTMDNPPQNVSVLGNEIALGILVRNIVDNAIRYTPDKGNIYIEIQNKKNNITLKITDTGPGIPPELRKNVFDRFYRILGTQSQGSGLGLAIVAQIAKLHHATIILDSPSDHSGLLFMIHFPVISRAYKA